MMQRIMRSGPRNIEVARVRNQSDTFERVNDHDGAEVGGRACAAISKELGERACKIMVRSIRVTGWRIRIPSILL